MGGRRRAALILLGVAAAIGLFSASRFAVWPFGPKWVRIVRPGGEGLTGALVRLQRPEGIDYTGETSSGSGWIDIPRESIRRGQEMLVVAQGCGILRGRLPAGNRVELPLAILVRLRIDGDFELPVAPLSLNLKLEWPESPRDFNDPPTVEDLRMASEDWVLQRAMSSAVAPVDYWEREWMGRDPNPDFDVDPATRSVDVLFPCGGQWLLQWHVTRTTRDGPNTSRTGHGPSQLIPIVVPMQGGTVVVAIDPREIERYRSR
jgi:hypothetical protein